MKKTGFIMKTLIFSVLVLTFVIFVLYSLTYLKHHPNSVILLFKELYLDSSYWFNYTGIFFLLLLGYSAWCLKYLIDRKSKILVNITIAIICLSGFWEVNGLAISHKIYGIYYSGQLKQLSTEEMLDLVNKADVLKRFYIKKELINHRTKDLLAMMDAELSKMNQGLIADSGNIIRRIMVIILSYRHKRVDAFLPMLVRYWKIKWNRYKVYDDFPLHIISIYGNSSALSALKEIEAYGLETNLPEKDMQDIKRKQDLVKLKMKEKRIFDWK